MGMNNINGDDLLAKGVNGVNNNPETTETQNNNGSK